MNKITLKQKRPAQVIRVLSKFHLALRRENKKVALSKKFIE
jgi:hypothetical protein